MLELAVDLGRPVAIRYPKAIAPDARGKKTPVALGKAELIEQGKDVCIIALGSMVSAACQAAQLLHNEKISASVINARFVRPLDENFLKTAAKDCKVVATVEEGISDGGFGSAVSEALQQPVTRFGLPCQFIPHGKREQLLEKYGLSAAAIAARIKKELSLHG
jgi:1-deoxy-D-xylulose-5-phosphate synthase